MIKRVDRYVGGTAIKSMLIVWIALTTLMMMFELLDELGSISGRYQLKQVLWVVFLSGPQSAYQVFPVSALLGALIGIGGLAATNELVAFRTAGVSRLRISGSVMGGALLVALAVMVMGEWVAPSADIQSRTFKQSLEEDYVVLGGPHGLWIRDGADFVNIKRPVLTVDEKESRVTYQDIVAYSFGEEQRIDRIIRADSANYNDGVWAFEGARDIAISEEGVIANNLGAVTWDVSAKPDLLHSAISRPRYMSVRDLTDQIEYLQANGLDDRVYRSATWAKLVFPFTVIALVLSGMPFVFSSARHQNVGVRVFIGMSLGGLFMIVSRAAQNYGDAYSAPIFISTVAPSLLLVVAVIFVLRRSV